MSVTPECVAAVVRASGDTLSESEAADLIRRMEGRRDALLANGRTENIDRRLAELAEQDAERAKIEAKLAQKHAALNAIVRDRLEDLVAAHTADGLSYPASVLALLEGVNRNVTNGRLSVANVRRGFESMFVMDMAAALQRDVPDFWRLSRQRPFQDNIVREMEQLKESGTPGITKDKKAQTVARIFRNYTELSRRNLNARGANIGKMDGWAGPHSHNPARLLRAGKDVWVRDVLSQIDAEKSFPELTPDEVGAVVADIYDTIITGRDNRLNAREKGAFTGPANVAKSISRHRVLHFRDADAWLKYNEKYGDGHVVNAVVGHQMHAAKIAAQMQMLGPNPDVMLGSLMERLQRRVRNDPKIKDSRKEGIIGKLSLTEGPISSAMAEMHGLTTIPDKTGLTAAQISSGIRAAQSMAKLGSSLASQFNDLVIGASALRYNGVPLGTAYYNQFKALVRGRTPAEQKEISFLVGVYGDGLIDRVVNRFSVDDGLPGFMTRAQTAFFRFNGMTWMTDTTRGALGRTLSAHLGKQTGKRFDKLHPSLQREFGQYGITLEDWDVIRSADFRNIDGNSYLTADRVAELPLERFGEGTKAERARSDLELKLRTYLTDQVYSGIIEPSARSRRWLLRGTRPGTVYGEVARFFAQFKGFPMAYVERPLGRAFAKGAPMSVRAVNVAHLIALSTVAGYVSMIAKDFLLGYEPRDPFDEDYWLKNWGAAFMQGGGLGIFGDFLFGQARHDQGPLETMAGPAAGTASQLLRMWWELKDGEVPSQADWFNMLAYNTPGQNLWWLRAAGINSVLDELREGMNPGYTARRDARRLEEFGQERIR